MNRQALFCDFCGARGVGHTYSTDGGDGEWHACFRCAELIHEDDWTALVERCLAAYQEVGTIPEDETILVLQEIWSRLFTFQHFALSPSEAACRQSA